MRLSHRLRAILLGAGGLAMAAVFAHVVPQQYPIGEWVLWRFALMWAYALLFTLAALSVGHLLLSRVFRVLDRPLLETLVLSFSLGVAAYGIVFHVVGAVGLLRWVFPFPYTAACLLAGGLGLLRRVRRDLAGPSVPERLLERGIVDDAPLDAPAPQGVSFTLIATLSGALGVFALSIVYLGIMTPDAIGYDAAWQHLVVAQDYARNGKLVPFPADWAKNHPQLAAIVFAWAFLSPGLIMPEHWVGALHLELVAFLFTLAGVAAVVRVLTGDRPVRGAWAGFFLFPAIFVYDCNLQGAADHVLSLFTLPAFLAALRAGRSLARRDMALVGAFVGAATLVKYQSMYIAGAAAIPLVLGWLRGAWLRLRRREGALSWAELARLPLIVLGVMMLVCSPHFIRNAVFYGNPFYPYMQQLIASHPTYPNADFYVHRTFLDPTLRLRGKLPERIADVFNVLLTFSWVPHYFGWSREYPAMGSLFTLSLPLSLLLPRPRRLTWIALLAGFAGLVLWTLNYRTDRNLQVMVPLFAAGTVAVLIHAWRMGVWARIGLTPLVLLQILWASDSISVTQHRQVSRTIDFIRRGWENIRFPGVWEDFRADRRAVNDYLPEDAKVVLHMHHMSLGMDREVLFDWAGSQGLFNHTGLSSPLQIWQSFKDQGVTHIVSIPGAIAASTRGEDVLFGMLLEQAGQGKIIGNFRIDALPAKAPRERLPVDVLTLGMWGYRDGLYPVSALNVHEQLAARWQHWPLPEEPLPFDDDARIALVAKASAVLVGRRGVPGPVADASGTMYSPLATVQPMRQRIERSFYRAASYEGGLELFLRKPKFQLYSGPVALP